MAFLTIYRSNGQEYLGTYYSSCCHIEAVGWNVRHLRCSWNLLYLSHVHIRWRGSVWKKRRLRIVVRWLRMYILCRYVLLLLVVVHSSTMLLSDFPLFWSCFKKHTRGSIRQNEFTVKIGSRPLMGKVPISPTTLKILNTSTTYRLWSRHQMSLRPFMISNPLFLLTIRWSWWWWHQDSFFFHLDLFCGFI